ncbi:MAG: glycosyltransferase, partial [Gammaproteobacteria bacterium]|nr:glycosyltransferase [Gammaproteobacteria bacterium]
PRLVIHAHCAYPDGVGVAWAASILRLPFVITAHGSDINVYARKKLIGGQVANALRAAAAVIGVSKPLIEKMQGLTRLPFNRFNEIPCAGFDPLVFIPREREYARKYLTMPIAGRVLLFVGNLVPIKGIPIILEAWALLKKDKIITDDDRVVLVGIGTQREMLTKQAIIKDIAASTLFIGGQMHERIPYWLNAANALVLASYNEGTPNVIIEALACGIPVIATAVGGVPYLLEGTGLPLVHPGDAQALADAIQKAFSQPWDARALQARVQDYTWSALAEKNVELLRDVAERMYG